MLDITLSLICCRVNCLNKNACHISLTAPLNQRQKAYHSSRDPDLNQGCCGPNNEKQSLCNHCTITATWSTEKNKTFLHIFPFRYMWVVGPWKGKKEFNIPVVEYISEAVREVVWFSWFWKDWNPLTGKKQDENTKFLAYHLKCTQSTRNGPHKPLEKALFASCR